MHPDLIHAVKRERMDSREGKRDKTSRPAIAIPSCPMEVTLQVSVMIENLSSDLFDYLYESLMRNSSDLLRLN